ncbi:MAG: hypothetical protein NT136_00860 [Candidatus Moranbacteria bacterium]|nr:hypothetical protein [Candidatus Moranbacteria bacterium]
MARTKIRSLLAGFRSGGIGSPNIQEIEKELRIRGFSDETIKNKIVPLFLKFRDNRKNRTGIVTAEEVEQEILNEKKGGKGAPISQ